MYSKDNNASSSQDLYPRNTIVNAGDFIINGFFEDRVRRKNHVVKVQIFQVRMWKICGITSYQ